MPYSNIPVSECISEFLLFDLAFVCDGDRQAVELTIVEDSE